MKIRTLLSLAALSCLSAGALNAQMIQDNWQGTGQVYAASPGHLAIGYASPGYTGGAAQSAGAIGEGIVSVIPSGSAASLTTATAANVTSIALTPGVWEISWTAYFLPAASTSVTNLQAGVSTTTATLPALTGTSEVAYAAFITAANVMAVTANPFSLTSGTIRVNITANTTYYLVQQATFTVSTMTGFGWIAGRRMR